MCTGAFAEAAAPFVQVVWGGKGGSALCLAGTVALLSLTVQGKAVMHVRGLVCSIDMAPSPILHPGLEVGRRTLGTKNGSSWGDPA